MSTHRKQDHLDAFWNRSKDKLTIEQKVDQIYSSMQGMSNQMDDNFQQTNRFLINLDRRLELLEEAKLGVKAKPTRNNANPLFSEPPP